MKKQKTSPTPLSRRQMLNLCKGGFGALAFWSMAGPLLPSCSDIASETQNQSPLSPKVSHHVAKAKSVIFLFMDGGVSQVDSFDPKPRLARENGLNPYDKFKVDATQFNNIGRILKSPWEFTRYGDCGMPVSALFPHIGSCADDIALIRSMVADFPEHTNANYFLHTGIGIQGRPSMGAWVTYGLGSENDNLPGYVVLDGGLVPPGGLDNFKSGFLPASYQASMLRAEGLPMANIRPGKYQQSRQQAKLDLINRLDQQGLDHLSGEGAIESAIQNYELAFRMQAEVPALTEFSGESMATQMLYGMMDPDPHTRSYGAQCLMARRLVEKGVRFIELTCPQTDADRWDQHSGLKDGHERNAHAVDQPIAGLIKDLKIRGLLEETLLVFAGEFGRTPFAQGRDGRDHNPSAFSIWLAGGGVKGGTLYGRTDDYGYRVVENPTTVHDLHATMLHLLGLDHEQLTYRFSGRDIRLTDVHGRVITEILA